MRPLGSGSLVLLDQAIISGASFATTVIVARTAGPEELAPYGLVMTLLVLIGGAHEALISQPYTVYAHRIHAVARRAYLGSAFASLVGLAGAVALGLLCVGLALPAGVGPAGLAPLLLALAGAAPCWLLREFARRTAIAHLDVATALVLDASVAVLQFTSLAWLAATGALTGLTAIVSVAAATALGGLGWLVASRHDLRIRPRHLARHWRRNWKLGRWILASRVMAQLNSDGFMTWLLLFLAGPAAAGVLTACLTVVFLSNPIVIGFGLFLAPRMARTSASGGITAVRELVWQSTLGLAVVLALVVGVLALVAEPVLRLTYGSQFAGSEITLVTLAIALAVSAVGLGTGSGLLAIERADLNLAASVCGFVVLMVVAPLLITRWNVFGAALALIVGNTVETATRLLLFWRQARTTIAAPGGTPLGARYQEKLS